MYNNNILNFMNYIIKCNIHRMIFQVKTNNENTDYYRMAIGIRTLQWTSKTLLLNDEPIYLRGFGKHEDSIVSDV